MNTLTLKHWLVGIAFLLLALIAGLWSWNTLAELFGLPSVGFKHVIAAGGILWFLRWAVLQNRRSGFESHGHHHE